MSYGLEPSWGAILVDELQSPKFVSLQEFLCDEYAGSIPIYPPKEKIFEALWKTPFDQTRVVIVGQDPYHGPNQAHGLCFSVVPGQPCPPSLQNIFKELKADLGISIPDNGCLERWAEQGVLLLNTILTVRDSQPFSHRGCGWEAFTDKIVAKLGERNDPPIFVLWGKAAQDKCLWLKEKRILPPEHLVVSAHPSPFSAYRGFFGSRPFSKVNMLLESQGKTSIHW